MILDEFKNKTPKEIANIKGKAVATLTPKGVFASAENGVRVEIISITAIEGGVEIFAKGWRGDKQLGFGADGSTEIERFLIYNPEILVLDPRGNVIEKDIDSVTNEVTLTRYREDPAEATKQAISHNVKLVGMEDTEIVKGKIGNTTSTFFSNTSGDGQVERVDGGDTSGGVAFATLRAGNGTSSNNGGDLHIRIFPNSIGNWYIITRSVASFDTSAIPDTDIISSATLTAFVVSKSDTDGVLAGLAPYSATPASPTSLSSSDYQQCGTTKYAPAIAYASLTTSANNDFVFNASGLSAISKTGWTSLCMRESSYDGDGGTPTWSYSGGHNNDIRFNQGMKLVVVHAAPSVDVDDSREAELHGEDTSNDSRDAELHGIDTTNNARAAETHGKLTSNDSRSAELTGSIDVNDSRSAELHGITTTNDSRSAEVHGINTITSARSAELTGSIDSNDSRPAELHGETIAPDSRPAEVHGIDTTNDTRPAETHGQVSTNDSRSAELHGEASSTSNRSAELHGKIVANDSKSAEVHGETTDNDSRSAELTGALASTDNRDAEVHGIDTTEDSRSAEVHGKATVNDSRSAELNGNGITNSARSAEIHGIDTTNDSRSAEISGGLGTNSTRSAEIIGKGNPYCPTTSPYSPKTNVYTPYPSKNCP